MRSLSLSLLSLALLAAVALSRQEAPNVVPSDPLSPADEARKFVLPDGFEAQLVACEPDIKKPMNLAFDDQGRLWVTDSIEYPFPARPGMKPRDTVKVLDDFGPTGRARRITTFSGGLNIPIGVLPLPGTAPRDALVYSIPNIYRLRDSTGDGVANQRDILYGAYEFRDTHGMTSAFTLGFDGWVYACHGYANRSTIRGKAGPALTMHSGNTYRIRSDGSRLEQWTWGQVNPFGLCLDPWGNLYSADCHSEPIYQLLRGGYYPSFGKPHDGLDFAPVMVRNYRGSTAIAGVVYYAADHFPPAYQGSAFVGDVMTNQIVHFKLSWTGTTPHATQAVLLQSKDQWFRPVDLKLGPDGALYVADFYNRIIGHYEVPLTHPGRDRERGRIWRIVYRGKDHHGTLAPRFDWTKASVKELAGDLAHPNLTVRMQATQQLVKRGQEAVAAVRTALDKAEGAAATRAHALWVLERLGALEEADLVKAARDRDNLVRAHVQRVLAERGKLPAALHNLSLGGLKDASPHVQRAAAEALGQHPDTGNIRPLLALRHSAPESDTHLVHVVRMALRNQLRRADTWETVGAGKWSEKDARALADVALGVPLRDAGHFLTAHIAQYPYPIARLANFVRHAARHGNADDTKALLAWAQKARKDSLVDQAALVRAIDRGTQERGATLPAETRAWANELAGRLLGAKGENDLRLGTELVGAMRLTEQEARVVELAGAVKAPDAVRVAALNALAALEAGKHAGTLGKVLSDAATSYPVREHAAGLLARANQPATRAALLAAMPAAPARLQNSIAAGMVLTREGAEQLLAAVAAGKASARLLTEKAVSVRLLSLRLPDLRKKLAKLTAGLPAADARLAQLIESRRKGYLAAKTDAVKGAAVFEKHCGNCHQVAGKGAKIGPQLDGIGLRGLERLLEDVLDPNRNVDQAFRLTEITTVKGQVIPGLLLREEGAVLVLADSQGKEVRVRAADVDKRTTSQVSPMPANLAEQIAEADFYHLMAYLLSLRPSKP
jgi:putative heme-binding domain-containing protein